MPKFFKYAGSKKDAARIIALYMRNALSEGKPVFFPFIGSGGLFWHLMDKGSLANNVVYVNDANPYLIEAWKSLLTLKATNMMINELECLREREETIGRQATHKYVRGKVRNGEYATWNEGEVGAAFIYLCQTSYNGLWRVNSAGKMNTPPSKVKLPSDWSNIRRAAHAIQQHGNIHINCRLWADEFEWLKSYFTEGVVYCDPPYYNSSHIAYHKGFKEWEEEGQRVFERECHGLVADGLDVFTSNSAEAIELWKEFWECRLIDTKRSISCKSNGRGVKQELLTIGLKDQ
jgi:DNA adenine methylase